MMFGGILKNWPYKLLALVASVLLWNHVQNERNPVTFLPAKVTISTPRLENGYIATVIPAEVPVTLQGPKLQIADIDPKKDITALVDLTGLDVGTHRVPIKLAIALDRKRNVSLQSGLREVAVTIESLSTRTMPLEVKLKTSPPIGWTTNDPAITPGLAVVKGRSSLVNRVSRLSLTVDATPLRPAVDENVGIKAFDSRGEEVRGVTIDPQDARVVLKLVESPANKAVFVSPNITGQPQFPYRVTKVTVNPDSVNITGRPEGLVGTSTITTDEVDVGGATGDVVRRVTLRVPPGLNIAGPGTVKVTVRIEQGNPAR